MKSIYFPTKDAEKIVDTNVDAVCFVTATMSNIQGDPNGGSNPRVTPDGYGYFTPPGFKAKVRKRYLDVITGADGQPTRIWIQKDAVLSRGVEEACKAVGLDITNLASDENDDPNVETPAADEAPPPVEVEAKGKGKKKVEPRKLPVTREQKETAIRACAAYLKDFALFGGVLTKPFNVGVKGPIQVGMSFSVNPIAILPIKITRMAVANEKEAESKVSTMGDLNVVRFGLYRTDITVSPFDAARMGLTWGDLDTFFDVCQFIWSHTRAGARGGVAFERLDLFLHDKKGGSCPSEAIFRSVIIDQKSAEVPTSIRDFDFRVRSIPGVTHSVVRLLEEEAEAVAAE
jgi:CRISPR-associated protein Csd2